MKIKPLLITVLKMSSKKSEKEMIAIIIPKITEIIPHGKSSVFFLFAIQFQHSLLKFPLLIQDNLLDVLFVRAVGLRLISCEVPIFRIDRYA